MRSALLQSTCLCFPLTNMDGQPHSCNEQFCDVKNLVLWCRRCNQTLKGPPHPSNPSGFFQPPFQSPPSQPLALETAVFHRNTAVLSQGPGCGGLHPSCFGGSALGCTHGVVTGECGCTAGWAGKSRQPRGPWAGVSCLSSPGPQGSLSPSRGSDVSV